MSTILVRPQYVANDLKCIYAKCIAGVYQILYQVDKRQWEYIDEFIFQYARSYYLRMYRNTIKINLLPHIRFCWIHNRLSFFHGKYAHQIVQPVYLNATLSGSLISDVE